MNFEDDNSINVYTYRELTDEQRMILAECIKRDNRENASLNCKPVVISDSIYLKYIKRCLDIIISTVALLVCVPFNLVIMVVTFFDVGHPIIFKQNRIGKNRKIFKLVKFRNMTNERDENGTLLPASERVTKWGKFVRKTSLDELLNFWSVLKGDMSIIGPRPMPDEYLGRFSLYHDARHWVRPGLECPLHDKSITEMSWDNRFENDVWYVENVSFKVDVKLLLLLIKDALWGVRREIRAEADIGCFMGYNEDGTIMNSHNIPQKYYYEVLEMTEKVE